MCEGAKIVPLPSRVVATGGCLGLATLTALLAGTGRGAQLGIPIRGPQVLEDALTSVRRGNPQLLRGCQGGVPGPGRCR